ncbi:ribonuclease E inhibitor RraB [Stenotrophomonas sp. 24(2023)]|uniref:ribonuclease E inhibitor RraB n=1 Tax=Stenotrophomonas sp. 24(2023) TaxID=3068324 RepID=UPI0027E04001|nr:ribonuclease E inhibitor RraB [Stenotrophomonas sp. 24(2023)]WMJ69969.1 ribonuclease E inhibitor RraB [Stenotrophomonas sp. 24(2023)]
MDLAATRDLFANLRENTDWDLQAPLLWGYYFVHATADRLQALAQTLAAQGYTVVELFEQVPDEGEAPFHVLHVERVEVHDEASLDLRNQELAALAAQLGVEDYDGMDVGPAPGAPTLQ